MRRVAGRELWLGHAGDLRDVRAVMACEIQAVVELADCEPMAVLPRDLIRLRFPLADGGTNPVWRLRMAIESVASLLKARVPVLVCCSAGLSRSVCVAAAGVALAERWAFSETLQHVVGAGPADVSPGLFVQIQHVLNLRTT